MLNSFILIIVEVLVLLLWLFIIVDFLNFLARKAPSLPSDSLAIKNLLSILEEKQSGTFVDLGCGMASVIIAVKKRSPKMNVVGYENWPTQFLLAKILSFFSGVKVDIYYRSFFRADLEKADIIFCYLFPNVMARVESKIRGSLKTGAIFISSSFPLPDWKPSRIIPTGNDNKLGLGTLFIYQKG